MTQADLNRAVADATGETVSTITEMGFSIADPQHVRFDPEPYDPQPTAIDWDEVDAQRNVVFPMPQRGSLEVA